MLATENRRARTRGSLGRAEGTREPPTCLLDGTRGEFPSCPPSSPSKVSLPDAARPLLHKHRDSLHFRHVTTTNCLETEHRVPLKKPCCGNFRMITTKRQAPVFRLQVPRAPTCHTGPAGRVPSGHLCGWAPGTKRWHDFWGAAVWLRGACG